MLLLLLQITMLVHLYGKMAFMASFSALCLFSSMNNEPLLKLTLRILKVYLNGTVPKPKVF